MISGEQPHSCDICGLKFSHLNSLKRHGLIHQKDYKCKICGKQFNDKSILKIHLVMHEKELPFQCSICNKGCIIIILILFIHIFCKLNN